MPQPDHSVLAKPKALGTALDDVWGHFAWLSLTDTDDGVLIQAWRVKPEEISASSPSTPA